MAALARWTSAVCRTTARRSILSVSCTTPPETCSAACNRCQRLPSSKRKVSPGLAKSVSKARTAIVLS
ncbi:hypothetical protein [Lysobacter gummosus]|uniref:hypothetical protein n=1 Tax=Lysobacter gummosus TaxID=262324 RepID=UPI0036305913